MLPVGVRAPNESIKLAASKIERSNSLAGFVKSYVSSVRALSGFCAIPIDTHGRHPCALHILSMELWKASRPCKEPLVATLCLCLLRVFCLQFGGGGCGGAVVVIVQSTLLRSISHIYLHHQGRCFWDSSAAASQSITANRKSLPGDVWADAALAGEVVGPKPA